MSAPTARLAVLAVLTLAACGGEPAPPPVTPPPTPPTAEPAPAPPPSAEPSAAPSATPSADPAADAPPAPKPTSGRPPVLKTASAEIVDTFGSSPAAKLEIGEKEIATLKIPENALDRGYNVTWKLDPKGKSTQGLVGKIYRTQMQIAGQPNFTKVDSAGPPFELTFPAGNKKDANLAIGEIVTDDKGREKIVWQVIAPKKIDDVAGMAYFEVSTLGDYYLHVTTKAPTPPPAAK